MDCYQRSFLLLLGDNSLLDFNLFKLVSIKTVGKSLGKILLFGFESVQIFSFSDLELGDSFVLLDEDGYANRRSTFFGDFLSVLGSFVTLGDFQELLEFGDFFRLNKRLLTIWWLKYNPNKYYNISKNSKLVYNPPFIYLNSIINQIFL